jgi:hypothetical protein
MRAFRSQFAQMTFLVALVQPVVAHWRVVVISVLRGAVSMPVVYA